eukprot:gene2231-2750_t
MSNQKSTGNFVSSPKSPPRRGESDSDIRRNNRNIDDDEAILLEEIKLDDFQSTPSNTNSDNSKTPTIVSSSNTTSSMVSNRQAVTWHAGQFTDADKQKISTLMKSSQAKNVLPIEFRTMSIQVSDTIQANNARKLLQEIKKAKEASNQTSAAAASSSSSPSKVIKATNDTSYFASLDTHKLSTSELSIKLGTDSEMGLPASEAIRRLNANGPNQLSTHRPNYLKKILYYLFGGFCGVLWVGVIVFFLCWQPLSDPPSTTNLALAILIIIVILTQAAFSAFQDWSTSQVMNSILNMIPSDCIVIRNGQNQKVKTTELVTGDLVQLNLGNKIPADIVMVQCADIKVDKSVLTGESKPILCTTQCTDDNFLESRNIVLMGTHVINGSGLGLVVLTGDQTVMGRINRLTNETREKVPLILREINRFVLIIVGMTIILAGILALEWGVFLRPKHPEFQSTVVMLMNLMSCVVAFIPEGVPVAVSLTLLMVAKRMKDNNILPKALTTVETLGCVNVICSDKTGTLTQNKMKVTSVGFVDFQTTPDLVCQDLNYNSSSNNNEGSPSTISNAYNQIKYASILCNNSTWDANTMEKDISVRQINGDATDSAIFRFGHTLLNANPSGIELDSSFHRLHDLPFNSKNKFMMTVHCAGPDPNEMKNVFGQSINIDRECLMIVKGAPDVILPRCTSVLVSNTNEIKPITDETLESITKIQEKWSRDGQRVILLTRRFFTPINKRGSEAFKEEADSSVKDLTIVGLLGLMDPPRPEIFNTIAQARRSGSRFLMVTGDFGLTAASIARQIGIYSDKDSEPDNYHTIIQKLKEKSSSTMDIAVQSSPTKLTALLLSGPDLELIQDNEHQWNSICEYDEIVFSRTTPEQKLRIVKEFQKRDNVVAVTGDGVNDAPALRAADVGVALLGCDVAVEAADLVLLGSFDSITEAMRLGRLVFQNLQKVIGYLLPAGSYSEITPVLVNAFFGTPGPLSSFQMIIICCFTDLFPCLSLIMEREEMDLMALPPRNAKKDHLITLRIYIQSYLFMGTMLTVISQGLFFSYLKEYTGLGWNELKFTYGDIDFSKAKVTEEEFNNYYVPVGTCVTFIALVILQWGNILSIRNRRQSILKADPFRPKRRNLWIFLGMLFSLIIAIIVTEVPWFHTVFITQRVPIKYWLLPVPFAVIILIIDELRKLCVRHGVWGFTQLAW